MNPSVLRFSIDLQNYDRPYVVNVKQGTNKTKLIINVIDGGRPYIFEEGTYVTYTQTTPNKNTVSATCDLNNNQIILELPPDATFENGESDCEFSFFDKSDNKLTSPHIVMMVHASLLHEYASTAIASDSFGTLTTAIASSLEATENSKQATAQAIEIKEEIETKLANGEFNGKSAYEIAQANGFSGSEEDWLKARNPSVDGHTLILPYVELGE